MQACRVIVKLGTRVFDVVKEDGYYGGEVAAPLFSRVTEGALRLMNVPPNIIDDTKRGLLLTESREP